MLVEQGFFQILVQDAGVAALLSQRVYAGILPEQVTYPAVAYRVIRRQTIKKLDPPGQSSLVTTRFRCFSTVRTPNEYGAAAQVDRAVQKALNGFAGTITDPSSSPVDSMVIAGIFFRDGSGSDFYDDPTQTWQRVSEFDVSAYEQ